MQQRSRSLAGVVSRPTARFGMACRGGQVTGSPIILAIRKLRLRSAQRLYSHWYGRLKGWKCWWTGTQCNTPATFLLYDRKRIECAIAIDTERSRELRYGTPFVCVQWRVTFLTARRTDTSVMIVGHWKHLCAGRRPTN